MSSPAEFYNSLPPISKAYGTLCLLATTAFQLGLYDPGLIALDYGLVFKHFQVWRLFTNFFFLGKFSINFGIRLLMIARYGVQLENGPFQRRTADFLWMMIFGALTLLVCEDLFQAMHLDVVIVAGLCLAFLYSFSLDFFVFLFLWEHFMKSSHLWVFGCWVFILGWIFMPICYNLPYYIYFLLNRYFLLSRSSPFQS